MKVRYNNQVLVAFIWILTIFFSAANARPADPIIGKEKLNNASKKSPYKDLNLKECAPHFEQQHVVILCRELAESSHIPTPLIKNECRTIVQYEYQDQYFDLGCSVSSFSGYFDPARWTSNEVQGAGGVDVTGAPDPKLLVEGTDNVLMEVANGQQTQFKLVAPASGFITFEWDLIGSSTTTTATRTDFLKISINQKHSPLQVHTPQAFRSPYLHSGDIISFELTGQQSVQIKQFQFLSNASGIIERQWSALSGSNIVAKHTQYIAIERPNISNIKLPEHLKIEMNGMQDCLPMIHPSKTGFPYYDKDGDEQTINDRIYLEPGFCDLDILWEDEIEYTQSGIVIHRKWLLLDLCKQNRLEQTQSIELKLSEGYNYPVELLQNYPFSTKNIDQDSWSAIPSYQE